MRVRALGGSGHEVSELALGSWLTLGGRIDDDATTRLIQHAFELGIRLFDTADVYQDGEAERTLGGAIADLPRDQLMIATKCFFETEDRPSERGLSRGHVMRAVDDSLRRLGLDVIDIHQCHRADPDTPLEETVGAYDELIRAGKLRHWGVSLWPPETIEAACRVADEMGAPRPISNQPEYSILERGVEYDALERGARLGLGHLVFSPLAQGALTGKYSGGRVPERSRANDAKRNRWMDFALGEDTLDRIDALGPLAEAEGRSMAQLAIAWCLRRPEVSCAIIGASRPEQIDENVRTLERPVAQETLDAIDALFPPPAQPAPTSTSPFSEVSAFATGSDHPAHAPSANETP